MIRNKDLSLKKVPEFKKSFNNRSKKQNFKSLSPRKIHASSRKRHEDSLNRANPKISNRRIFRKKLDTSKISGIVSLTKKSSFMNEMMRNKTKKLRRKLVKGKSTLQEKVVSSKLNPTIFNFDNFGDLNTPKKFHSRKCEMDLSKLISEEELEKMKYSIIDNYKSPQEQDEL